ncbi:MAG TPA: hypothetical protein VF530_10835 [Planctomycetota bacterium]
MKHCALAVVGLFTLVTALAAQTPRILLKEGDPLIGGQSVQRFDYVTVGDSGAWVARVETFDFDFNRDVLVLRSGFPVLREGMVLPQPANAILDDFGSLDVASNGDLAMHLLLREGPIQRDGLYWNLVPVALEGDSLDFAPFSPGTTLEQVTVVRLTEDRGLLALVRVRDPQISARPVDALIRFRLDAQGNVIDRTTLGARNMFSAVLGSPIDTLGTSTVPEHSLELNRSGDFVLPVAGIGRRGILKNMDTLIAEEHAPAPVAGRTWNANAFALSRVAINDRGEVAFTGSMTPIGGDPGEPTNYLIVKDGQKLAQSGDVLPALSPHPLAKGTPRIELSNRGNLFWRAQPVTASAGGAAYMLDQTPLIQEAVTVVEGQLVVTVLGGDDCFAVSPEGRYFVGRVILQGGTDAVVFLDFGLIRELEGCLGLNQGTLRHVSGAARVGQPFRVAMDDGPAPGAVPFLLLSSRSNLSAAGCGQFTVQGELMLAQPLRNVLVLPPWDGVNPSELDLAVPNSMALVNATFTLQGLFGIPGRTRTLRLTNALELQIGPP